MSAPLWELVQAGVWRAPTLDSEGYHRLIVVGHDSRVICSPRVFDLEDECAQVSHWERRLAEMAGGAL
ncbi:MAG: hypothetical protein ACREM1_06685 [Longimicrobiales bacterium]